MNEEDMKEWKSNPLTKKVFELIRVAQSECKDNALNIATAENAAVELAYLKGVHDGLENVVTLGGGDE